MNDVSWAMQIAAQLWCLPQHAHKEMDVEFAQSIALALDYAKTEGLAEGMERAARLCSEPTGKRSAYDARMAVAEYIRSKIPSIDARK